MTKLEVLELMRDVLCGCGVVVSDDWVVNLKDVMERIDLFIREEKINDGLSKESRRLFQRYAFLASNPFRTDFDDYEIGNILAKLEDLGTVPDFSPVDRKR